MDEFLRNGALDKLTSVFSRDNPEAETRHVQHAIRREKEAFADLLCSREGEGKDATAVLYVCGDARNMAREVSDTVVRVLQEVRGFSREEAKAQVAEMVLKKRYLQDVWT